MRLVGEGTFEQNLRLYQGGGSTEQRSRGVSEEVDNALSLEHRAFGPGKMLRDQILEYYVKRFRIYL